jgi:hypothetical protein
MRNGRGEADLGAQRRPVPFKNRGAGKKTPGGAGTATGHTGRRTSQPSQPTNAPGRPRDDRLSGRLNGRSP